MDGWIVDGWTGCSGESAAMHVAGDGIQQGRQAAGRLEGNGGNDGVHQGGGSLLAVLYVLVPASG